MHKSATTTQTGLVSAANLPHSVNLNHPGKLDISALVKVVGNAQAVAVPGKVVPLVNVDAVSPIGHNLQHRKH